MRNMYVIIWVKVSIKTIDIFENNQLYVTQKKNQTPTDYVIANNRHVHVFFKGVSP